MSISLNLYKKVEGVDGFSRGKFLGTVTLNRDDVVFDIGETSFSGRLKDFFETPLTYVSGESIGHTMVQNLKIAPPKTKEFFKACIYHLRDAFGIIADYNEAE